MNLHIVGSSQRRCINTISGEMQLLNDQLSQKYQNDLVCNQWYLLAF